jgi:LAO/AO transport system kinase
MLDMNTKDTGEGMWRPPIVATEAIKNQGVEELLSEIEMHKTYLFDHATTHLREHLRKKAFSELVDTIKESFVAEMIQELERSEGFEQMIDDLVEKRTDPISLCAHGGVACRLKMLTYCRVCCAFSPPRALP